MTNLHILRWHEVTALCPDRGVLQYACGNDECTWCHDATLDLSGILRPYAAGSLGWTVLIKLVGSMVDPETLRTLLGSGGGAVRPSHLDLDSWLAASGEKGKVPPQAIKGTT